MKIINLNTQEGVRITLFPDGQPHVNLQGIEEGDAVKVVCSITDTSKLLQLLQTANALDHLFAQKKVLVIPYLMGARYDRLMNHGDSIDLEVIAQLINTCSFEKVYLFDVHSDVAALLIHRSVCISNESLVKMYEQPNAVLICPDAGASKKIGKYFGWNSNIQEVVYCSKNRDLQTGALTLEVLEPAACEGRNCVIIDDICDGGGTFLAIAEKIKPAHLTLIVTHGIFSKGFVQLQQHFQHIIVSNSLYKKYDADFITCIPHYQ